MFINFKPLSQNQSNDQDESLVNVSNTNPPKGKHHGKGKGKRKGKDKSKHKSNWNPLENLPPYASVDDHGTGKGKGLDTGLEKGTTKGTEKGNTTTSGFAATPDPLPPSTHTHPSRLH